MKKFKNLLIDIDGTLLNVNEKKARIEFISRSIIWWRKYANPWKIFRSLQKLTFAMKSNDSLNISNYNRGVKAFATEMALTEMEAIFLLEKFLNEVFPKIKKYFSPAPGAKEFVEWASDRYKLILATNPLWPPEIVEMRMKWAGLKIELFSSYTHAKRMKFCKSYVNFFNELIEQEQINPGNCLMIGDDINEDGLAAKIGIDVFILPNKRKLKSVFLHKKTIIGAQIRIGDFSEIQSILEKG